MTSFGTSAIYAVGNLETVTFADGSQLKTIDDYNFNSCNALTTITLPASVTSIGDFVLYNCANLATVILNSSPRIENADRTFGDATVTMNLKANEGATGEYWTTYYNWSYIFQTADDTQIFKAALNGTTLELTELTTDKIVTKNEAVILKSTSPTITLTETSNSSSNNFNDNSLQGVNNPEGLTADDPSHIYVLNKTNAYGVGFYKLKAGKTLGMGKVYLTYIAPSSAKAIDFFAFDTATGIDEVSSKMEDVNGEDDVWYTLDGRRLSSKPTQRGIYIVGGKKVFIN